ncbi:MAG: hypothetical protein L3J91_03510 [Thermoplasmata archaeon]|nr:hypothetical protein [Thermoplasmata archaeon]
MVAYVLGRACRFAVPALIVLLLVAATLTTSVLSAAPAVSPAAKGSALPSQAVSASFAAPGRSSALSAASCLRPASQFPALWQGAWPPPTVSPLNQTPCAWGADESSLAFLSNGSGASDASDRASFTILLPPAGTAVAQTLASLSFRMWVSGVPCSFDGASQVSIQLVPPASPYGAVGSSQWGVRAPAYDLVPPSSCDPICSNDTALFTLDGAAWCEDQILRPMPHKPR